jgi:trimethylamine--corrinoid protein Co-methyltransferase
MWQRPSCRILSDDQIEKIYGGALEILERIGGDFHDEEAVDLLAGAGAAVTNGTRVRIPAFLVEEALQTVPNRVVISDRNGKRRLFLEGHNIYFGPGPDNPFTLDPYSGERRKTLKDDVAKAARVVDALPEMDFCMSFGLANDVNRMTSDCHHFDAMVRNTVKPLIVIASSLEGLKRMFDMMVAVKGTEERLKAQPFVIAFSQAVSPLVFSKEAIRKLLFCAEKGIPTIWTSGCPSIGSTGPIYPAAAAVLSLAEFLVGLVLAQLKKEGSPVIAVAGNFGALDMSTGVRPYAAPEEDLGSLCSIELARHFNIPTFGIGGMTDSKTLDQQAAAEACTSLLLSAISGANLIHDVGYMDNGLTSSLELLTLCSDFIDKTKRFLRSFVVSDETLALDLIEEVGPGGNYLAHSQTVEHFKEYIWMPKLVDRRDYEGWKGEGGKTLRQRANEKVRRILESNKPEELSKDVQKSIREIVEAYDRQAKRG